MTACLLLCLWLPAATGAGDLAEYAPHGVHDFTLPDLDGNAQTLADRRGRVVLVNFWASWCPPCVEEMPSIARLHEALRDTRFEVIAINVGEGERRVQTAARRLDLRFPVLLDREGETARRWGVEVLPTSYLVDQTGAIRYRVVGPLAWDDADTIETIRRLAKGPGTAVRPPLISGR